MSSPSNPLGIAMAWRFCFAQESIVNGWTVWLLLNSQAGGRVSLRIGVNQKNFEVIRRQGGCKINRSSGLAHSAFLVCYCNYLAQEFLVLAPFHVKQEPLVAGLSSQGKGIDAPGLQSPAKPIGVRERAPKIPPANCSRNNPVEGLGQILSASQFTVTFGSPRVASFKKTAFRW